MYHLHSRTPFRRTLLCTAVMLTGLGVVSQARAQQQLEEVLVTAERKIIRKDETNTNVIKTAE